MKVINKWTNFVPYKVNLIRIFSFLLANMISDMGKEFPAEASLQFAFPHHLEKSHCWASMLSMPLVPHLAFIVLVQQC